MNKKRKYYIDNIRVLLTCLVVLHHLAITYGGPGLWYYNETNTSTVAVLLLSLFIATNQAFFMGMFFMISAYFLEKSFQKKSIGQILKDKLKRLGIPLIFYPLVISPIIIYLIVRFDRGIVLSISSFLKEAKWLTFGPLWFVAALLIFTMAALLLLYFKKRKPSQTIALPSNLSIFGFATAIAVISFIVRIWFPVGWSLKPFGFQLGHFPQYILLFFVGYVASQQNWLQQITYRQSKLWLNAVLFMVFILFPLVFHFGDTATNGPEVFMGGKNWQSLVYCLWEQMVGIGIMVALLGIFKEKYPTQNSLLKTMSAGAYTVYIIHPLILVPISLLLKDVDLSASIKFIALAPIVLVLCFGLSSIIRKLPFTKGIL